MGLGLSLRRCEKASARRRERPEGGGGAGHARVGGGGAAPSSPVAVGLLPAGAGVRRHAATSPANFSCGSFCAQQTAKRNGKSVTYCPDPDWTARMLRCCLRICNELGVRACRQEIARPGNGDHSCLKRESSVYYCKVILEFKFCFK